MKKKNLCIILSFLAINYLCFSQESKISDLLNDFESNNWPTVLQAKESLENLESMSIPALIDLLKKDENKKLTNTGDLIYPGAEKFFGHGQIIDYDIDKINVRAGWLLEDLTFKNFGFSGIHIEASGLSDFIKNKFPEYYNNQKNREIIEKSSEKEKRELIRELSIKEAKDWWKKEGDKWSRYNSLIKSLQSNDERSQVKGLFYLRNGKSSCKGLTKEAYKEKIEPLVIELSKSNLKRISEQAKLIMVDSEFDWMAIKPINN